MLNESLKRRWPEPGFTYEPPQKVRLVSARNLQDISNSEPFSDLSQTRIICRDQPQNTTLNPPANQRIRPSRHHRPVSQYGNRTEARTEKRKLSSCEDCESLTIEQEDRYSSYHRPKRLKISSGGYNHHPKKVRSLKRYLTSIM